MSAIDADRNGTSAKEFLEQLEQTITLVPDLPGAQLIIDMLRSIQVHTRGLIQCEPQSAENGQRRIKLFVLDVIAEVVGTYDVENVSIGEIKDLAYAVLGEASPLGRDITEEFFFTHVRDVIYHKLMQQVGQSKQIFSDYGHVAGAFMMHALSWKKRATKTDELTMDSYRRAQLEQKFSSENFSLPYYVKKAQKFGIFLDEKDRLYLNGMLQSVPFLRRVLKTCQRPSFVTDAGAFQAACRCCARSIRTFHPKNEGSFEEYVILNMQKEFSVPQKSESESMKMSQ